MLGHWRMQADEPLAVLAEGRGRTSRSPRGIDPGIATRGAGVQPARPDNSVIKVLLCHTKCPKDYSIGY
jgi:hypothetical protein